MKATKYRLGVLAHRHQLRNAALAARPAHIQFPKLGQRQQFLWAVHPSDHPLVKRVADRLGVVLLLKPRVLGPPLEEVHEGAVLVAQLWVKIVLVSPSPS